MQVTVLKYLKVQLEGEWKWSYDEHVFVPAKDVAEAVVLTEDGTGGYQTHWFKVQPSDENFNGTVTLPKEENIVYISALCYRREEGDQTACVE